ncbi:MAG: GTPase ObgE [Candidatus Zambryskibacteria bacterium]|nr:GTPase ObgE [Candidatus Zambryskibacteria bacterium]
MFIDEITLNIKAGDGGHGIVAWRHEKGVDHAGPGGGDGGNGGDVLVRGTRDITGLSKYAFEKDFSAEDGVTGLNKGMKGSNGKDLILDMPIGSVLKNLTTGEEFDILSEEPVLILKGGRGGFGNEHFKGSRNITPTESTPGKIAEHAEFYIELKLVVDLGFVGLPNAGKSSLLNALTNAKAKIGNYQFTTLSPNLGDLFGLILADIPGLIEGASEGKGLGFKFLRHVARTRVLLHCISSDTEDVLATHALVRKELESYSSELATKEEYILLTKTDLINPDELALKVGILEKTGRKVLTVSTIDDDSLKNLSDFLVKMLRKEELVQN